MTGTLDPTVVHRTITTWQSPRGINADLVPWRLWEKAKQLAWDPADIDFSQDAEDWGALGEQQQIAIASLARTFMIGEEAVTVDIAPLIVAMADEGRLEEVIYLTSFVTEEAKHVDFFRRWFTAIGADPVELLEKQRERQRQFGIEVPDPEHSNGLFERELPRVMRRVMVDRGPEAVLDAGVTYNQFVEGCLAMSGYRVWAELFDRFGVLPGMQEGLRYIRRDESRHITYGTYLCRRVVAAHPDLLDFARQRLQDLRRLWWRETSLMDPPENPVDPDLIKAQVVVAESDGPMSGGAELLLLMQFFGHLDRQVAARTQVLERAATLSEDEAVEDAGAEEEEAELLG